MSNHYLFARNLVKGKIAETIFAQMLRESQAYTVLEFGYEKVIPELTQHGVSHDEILETLRCAPDFAVIDRDAKTVHLVEVKYRQVLDQTDILSCAKRMHASWNPSYMFVATLDGFYFDEISSIVNNHGQIRRFVNDKIPADVVDKYLGILRDFESGTFAK